MSRNPRSRCAATFIASYTKRMLGRREERGVPKRSELEPSTGLAERNGYAAESHPADGLTLELFSILSRYTQPLILPVGIGIK